MTTAVNFLKCAYCGIKQYPSSMIIVKKSIEEEWSAIFGDEFRRRLGKYRHICMKHLKGFENEKDDDDEDIQWFYENGRKICFNKFCCYCGPKTKPIKMCAVPTNEDELDLWNSTLGKKFQINSSKLRMPCICLQHFEENQDFPSAFQKGIPYDVLDELGKTSPGFHSCAYCLRLRGDQLLINVPKSPDFKKVRKSVWRGIRRELSKNGTSTNLSKSCHPKTSEIQVTCSQNLGLVFWTAGAEKYRIESMMHVPADQNTIIDWICVFGMDFEENCSFFRYPMICQSHVEITTKLDGFGQFHQHQPVASNPKPDFSISKNCRGIKRVHEENPCYSVRKYEEVEIPEEHKPDVLEFPDDLVLKIEPPEIKEEEEEMDIKPSTSEIIPNIEITVENAMLIEQAKQYEKLHNPLFGKCCYWDHF
ncbi:unnamed protein product [Caenorhabditis angaria]|uniref:Uncharacterized protein n=1 Tax=Caenorhabditis angaria TaxID=860376 RepID=A0A9P1I7W8_9PELO|nr:unnamed protein product [Caenorhabditis angaria]